MARSSTQEIAEWEGNTTLNYPQTYRTEKLEFAYLPVREPNKYSKHPV